MKKLLFVTLLMAFVFQVFSGHCATKRPGVEISKDKQPEAKHARGEELKYSVNLMWISRSLNKDQLYIHPSENEIDLQENFLSHIFKWADVSQGGIVNVWFDSTLTPAKAVENTWALIKEYARRHAEMAPIVLRDVREIPKVIRHPEVFSDSTPVYFRVDLLRPIIALHMLLNQETDYFVYGDLDMKPLSQEELFDTQTLQNLQRYGIVNERML